MNQHLAEISATVDRGAHAVLILDRAGWHMTPKLVVPANLTPADVYFGRGEGILAER